MFLHFNMGTFTDEEWATPKTDPRRFAPTALDCGQWADVAKAAGMKYAVRLLRSLPPSFDTQVYGTGSIGSL